jgi:hypothetical protein
MRSDPLTSGSLPSVPTSLYAPTKNLRRIGLAPFVALLFAYCAGGPFALESMMVGIRLTQVGPICSVRGWWKSIRVI